jgi:subtilisin family serine protease
MALPDRIYAQASPVSIGGKSLFAPEQQIESSNVAAFFSDQDVVSGATVLLQQGGFEVLQVTPLTINFSGAPDVFENAFQTIIIEKEMSRPNGPTTTYLDSEGTEMLGHISTAGTKFEQVIEGVALEVPRIYLSASSMPPPVDYWHLDVPADVASGCNATILHRFGITGLGVKVAMVDSGWFRHPYFNMQQYNVAPVILGPAASAPEHDESGHGTGESANILAIAPDCELHPVKTNFVNTVGAFNAAVALNPDIITCSWGSHTPFALTAADLVLSASVAAAIERSIIVIFSAGNGHAGFPGQHPDIISAGGVFMGPDGNLQASNYSSAFTSLIFPGRRVPDVCGLVGMRPKAIYIMLPVEPGDNIDTGNAGSVFPDGDQTEPNDGWAAFSGTSAAAPQLAGAAALIKQVVPAISPSTVKAALTGTARDVTDGAFSPVKDLNVGLPAASGTDEPTVAGLMDVYSAVVAAYVDSLTGSLSTSTSYATTQDVAAYYYALADAATAANMNPVIASYMRGIADASAALAYYGLVT